VEEASVVGRKNRLRPHPPGDRSRTLSIEKAPRRKKRSTGKKDERAKKKGERDINFEGGNGRVTSPAQAAGHIPPGDNRKSIELNAHPPGRKKQKWRDCKRSRSSAPHDEG